MDKVAWNPNDGVKYEKYIYDSLPSEQAVGLEVYRPRQHGRSGEMTLSM
jgi:hypothetical protein